MWSLSTSKSSCSSCRVWCGCPRNVDTVFRITSADFPKDVVAEINKRPFGSVDTMEDSKQEDPFVISFPLGLDWRQTVLVLSLVFCIDLRLYKHTSWEEEGWAKRRCRTFKVFMSRCCCVCYKEDSGSQDVTTETGTTTT